MKVEIYKGKNDRWYWRLVAGNGEIVAVCAGGKENGYATEDGATNAWKNVCTKIIDHFSPGYGFETRVLK